MFLAVRTLKNLVKEAENTPKDQGNSQEEKHQGNRNTKEKKDREATFQKNPRVRKIFVRNLSGMFRRSASLAIPHLKSFAEIPSLSLVQLGHTNRNIFLSHESQREIALIYALSRPIPYCQQGEVGKKWACVSQGLCF